MSEATIRAQIKTTLESVTGIGRVYDYRRTSRSVAKLLQLMRPDGETDVNGWSIYRDRCLTDRDSNLTLLRHHRFRISGLYQLSDADASEKTVQALCDTIFTDFLSDQTLGGTCLNSEPLQVDSIDADDVEGTSYHVIEMSIVCHERVTETP